MDALDTPEKLDRVHAGAATGEEDHFKMGQLALSHIRARKSDLYCFVPSDQQPKRKREDMFVEITLSSPIFVFLPPSRTSAVLCRKRQRRKFWQKALEHECLTWPRCLLGVVVLSSSTQIAFSGAAPQPSNNTAAALPQPSPPARPGNTGPGGLLRIQILLGLARIFQFSFTPSPPLAEFPWKQKQSSRCLGLEDFFSPPLSGV